MADYHPLIARAVQALDKSTGEARRALYERARTALVAQLRGVVPALSESEITKERLALEEAIRRVEAEAARKSRTEPQRPAMPPPRSTAAPPPAAAPTPSPPRERPVAPPGEPPSPPQARRAEPRRPETPLPQQEQYEQPEQPAAPQPRPARTGRSRWFGERPAPAASIGSEALKGYRDVVGEVDDLGAATAKSARAARENYGAAPRQAAPAPRSPQQPSADARRFEPRIDPEDLRAPDYDTGQMHGLEPSYDLDEAAEMAQQAGRPRTPREPPDEQDEDYLPPRPRRSWRGMIKLAVVLIILAGLASTVAWQWPNITGLYHFVRDIGSTRPKEANHETPQTRPKISERVPQNQVPGQPVQPGSPAPSGQAAPGVAQRVVLYEEDPNNPQGKRFVGSAIWRTETVSPGVGLAPELAVRADIEIPERRMTMTWSLRRNTDKSLPASHTVEIMFNLPADFPGGGISNVPGILMKQSEEARGTPLAGLAVKVTTNFFLIGLSAVEADVQRNVALLKERPWFDIPIVYSSGGRAILAMEKGTPGDRAFAEAFAAWSK
jgi:hypothetical protein